MRHATLTAVLLVAALGMGALNAHATTITLNGNIVASGTYEGDTVGSPPVADVGSWVDPTFGTRPLGVVTDAVSPGPFSGSQYLDLATLGSRSIGAEMAIALGDALRFESMAYVPTSQESQPFPWQVVMRNSAGSHLINFWRNANGTWEAGGAGLFTAPANFAHGVWQLWELDYTVGATSATLTIDGSSTSVPTSNTALSGTVYRMGVFNSGAKQIYLDAVPEPSTWILLVLGGGALAAVARRMRV